MMKSIIKYFSNFIYRTFTVRIICRKYHITNYTINLDGSIDVYSSVKLSHMNLINIPLKFRKVSGNFLCNNNKLTSLEGSPIECGDFYCCNNKLISLEGGPLKVNGNFDCTNNKLISLEGAPKYFGHFEHRKNNFISKRALWSITTGGQSKFLHKIIKYQDDYSIWNADNTLNEYRFNDMIVEIKEDLGYV